jgi:regulator of protease activity HflC (stomatin/prohibitin superfamily)
MSTGNAVTVAAIIAAVVILFMLIQIVRSVRIVPQSQNHIVERLGRYRRTLDAGMHIIAPMIETVRHKVDILERQLPVIQIQSITLDNVTIDLSLAIMYRIEDAARSVYKVQNVEQAIQTAVIGMVRSVIGKTDLDGVQSNRRQLSDEIEAELTPICAEWGIVLSRVEIVDVEVDEATKAAMQLQLNAERTRRAQVREAEGKKEASRLAADAELYQAERAAEARRLLADSEAYSVSVVAKAIAEGGQPAIEFEMRKLHSDAMKALAASGNGKLVLLPSDVLDTVSRLVDRNGSKGE